MQQRGARQLYMRIPQRVAQDSIDTGGNDAKTVTPCQRPVMPLPCRAQ